MPRKLSVIEQKDDLDTWKKYHEYLHRWIAESVFSAIKRILGEHVKAIRWKNVVKGHVKSIHIQYIHYNEF